MARIYVLFFCQCPEVDDARGGGAQEGMLGYVPREYRSSNNLASIVEHPHLASVERLLALAIAASEEQGLNFGGSECAVVDRELIDNGFSELINGIRKVVSAN